MKNTLILAAALAFPFAAQAEDGKACEKRDGARAQKKADWIAKHDTNGDGKVSKEELAAAMAAKKAEWMAKYDTNGDGEISEAEKEAAKADMHAKWIERFDKDGDGQLNEEEKKAAMKAKRRRHHRKGHDGKGRGDQGGDPDAI